MMDDEDLREKLQRWRVPETPASLDRRVMESYRRRSTPWWRRMMTARIEVPVPLFVAAQIVLVAAIWMVRSAPQVRMVVPAPRPAVLTTTFESRGFQPLPRGEIRVIREER